MLKLLKSLVLDISILEFADKFCLSGANFPSASIVDCLIAYAKLALGSVKWRHVLRQPPLVDYTTIINLRHDV